MQNDYKVVITSYDYSRNLPFLPIQSNSGDTDSVEILQPYNESSELSVANETQNSPTYFCQKPQKHLHLKKHNLSIEPNFISDRIEEKLAFITNTKKPSVTVNKSFSFANGYKNFSDIDESPQSYSKRRLCRPRTPHVSERLFRLSRVLQEKKEWWMQKNEENMLKDCSFKPNINKKSSFIAVTRSFKDLLKTQIITKNHEIPENEYMEDQIPKINKNSLKILKNSNYAQFPINQRLYSKERYHKDKTPEKQSEFTNFSTKTNLKTLQKAAERFKREYESIVNVLMINQGEISKDFTFDQILQVLLSLGFLTLGPKARNPLENPIERPLIEEMWKILNFSTEKQGKISSQRLFRFLLCVLGLDPKKMDKIIEESLLQRPEDIAGRNLAFQLTKDNENFKAIEENDGKLLELPDFSTEGDLCRYKSQETMKSLEQTIKFKEVVNEKSKILIDDGSCSKEYTGNFGFDMNEIHKKFQIFLRNRLMSQNDQTFKSHVENPQFTPNILRNSKEMASKAREKLRKNSPFSSAGDLVEMYQRKKKAKLNSLFLQKMEEMLESCKFKPEKISKNKEPKISKNTKKPNILKKLASPKFKIPERKLEDIEFEKNRKECTFKPNILVSKASNSSKSKKPLIMRKASKENKDINVKEVLVIDVKLNESRKEKILIYNDSDLNRIVEDFVRKHSNFLYIL